MELDNTFLLPHVGSATREDRIWMTEMAVANLAAGVRREALPHRAI
jgi:lactate dehydrogenase-like 2-hydroxyacid dehydrogenase